MNKDAEIADRRQRAREAGLDSHGDPDWFGLEASGPVNAAIEVATQVKLTPEIIEAAERDVWGGGGRNRARAVLEAAGFEVIE